MKKAIIVYSFLMLTFGSFSSLHKSLFYLVGGVKTYSILSPFLKLLDYVFLFPQLPYYDSYFMPKLLIGHFSLDGDIIKGSIVSFPYLISWILLLVGVIQYSKYEKARFVTFIFFLSFFNYFAVILMAIFDFFVNLNAIAYYPYSQYSTNPLWEKMLYFLGFAFHAILLLKFILFLIKPLELKVQDGNLIETSKSRRIIGRVLDFILVIFLAWKISLLYIASIKFFWKDLTISSNDYHIFFFNAFASFFYYLIFEAIFQRTPAKVLLGARVLNRDYEKPSFKSILSRTLYRFIPFEAILFLFDYRIHDRYSGTDVCDEE